MGIAEQLQREEFEALGEDSVVNEAECSRATLRRRLLQSDRDFTSDDYEMLLRLDEAPTRGSAAKEQKLLQEVALRPLPVRKVAKGEGLGNCSICLEEMLPNSEVRTLPCMHCFHRKCIDKWLLSPGVVPRCPVDQTEIPNGLS